MGLFLEEKERGIFMKISNGKINYKVDESTIGAIEVVYKDSQTGEEKISYKMEVPGLLGKIIGLGYRDSDYGRNLEVKIKDGNDLGILQFKSDSSLHHSFVNLLMNVDFDESVEITAWKQEKSSGGKTFTNNYVGIRQNGVKITPRHTKETDDGPQPNVSTVAGKKKWDFGPLEDYYFNVVNNELKPKLESITGETEEAPVKEESVATENADMSKESSAKFAPKQEEKSKKDAGLLSADDDLPF